MPKPTLLYIERIIDNPFGEDEKIVSLPRIYNPMGIEHCLIVRMLIEFARFR